MLARDVLIMVAPNGARRSKADHAGLPLTPFELAGTARACMDAGAAAIHLHVRDGTGAHSLDAGLYREAVAAVREATGEGFVIQITTEAVGRFTPRDQAACIRAVDPEAVSIALREIVPDRAAEADAAELFAWMEETGVAPQIILYEPAEVGALLELTERRIVSAHSSSLLFVLGRYTAGQQSTPADLDPFVAALHGRTIPWSVCAFGRSEAACALRAASLGGHIRVGFENNLHLPDGTTARSNAELVAATVRELEGAGFRPMQAGAARRVLRCRVPGGDRGRASSRS
ncbi:MAG: 3-keto-5-aminohexanoate cleavage protein [Parvibaculaceae bacterium]